MLPKILKPFHSDKSNLVRIGPKKDGGYVIDKRVIEKSEVIITCGLNDDWEFEKDFLNKNNSSRVEAYDHTVDRQFLAKKVQKRFYSIPIIEKNYP